MRTEEITEDSLKPLLRGLRLGQSVRAFRECDSTNIVARRLLSGRGAPPPHGSLVIAETQRAGYGRNGRGWVSPPGLSLLFTLILYPDRWKSALAGRATMALSLAVAEAAARAAAGAAIKWPNDVLAADGRKLSGILIERVVRPDGSAALVAGAGVNVNQTEADFPGGLRASAASLRQIRGRPVSRLRTLKAVLGALERLLETPDAALFDAWQSRCLTLGRTVRVRLAGRVLVAQALALEKDGGLVLRLPSGHLEVIHSGDVEELRIAEPEGD